MLDTESLPGTMVDAVVVGGIDVLFESAADVLAPNLAGVILAGANEDGARGALAIRRAGGLVVVQSPEDAQWSAMPRAALALCPDARVARAREISGVLQEVCTRQASITTRGAP